MVVSNRMFGHEVYLVGGPNCDHRKAMHRYLDVIEDKSGDGFRIVMPANLAASANTLIIVVRNGQNAANAGGKT